MLQLLEMLLFIEQATRNVGSPILNSNPYRQKSESTGAVISGLEFHTYLR
jgi:hypothetical protein